uniref:Methionine synthase reductase n=1 Tax=Chaetoceros debilis TaxID=122233 RepID=A0A7S3Q8M7_9STRA|mmetsp:Transcript_24059/g.36714  ORF Transcript_24059/g.36714 Transcript_24059/m.36714 type:complete len:1157 (-) Transcript_24059:50-3520(-)
MSELPLFILYGSATGNAESIAKDLAKRYEDKSNLPSPFTSVICTEANNFKKKCQPIWDTEPTVASAPGCKYGVAMVVSTTGNGDCPENGSRFLRYLKRKTTVPTQPMKHVAFAILALGDTNYDQYCESGIVADKKFLECGGVRVMKLGKADEGTGMMEDVVEEWKDNVVPMLAKVCAGKGTDTGGSSSTLDASKSEGEEKKMDDATPAAVTTKATPVPSGRPNVQSLLNRRLGVTSASTAPVAVPAPTPAPAPVAVPSGGRPNVQAFLAARGIGRAGPAVGSRPTVPAVNAVPVPVLTTVKKSQDVTAVAKEESSSTTKATSQINLKSPSPLYILYGSATGNAETIAKDLAAKYEKQISESSSSSQSCYFPSVVCCELDQYKKKCIKTWEDDIGLNHDVGQKHGLIIISSTTGNGDAPENASRFVRYIKRKSTANTMPFQHVAYAVLGLGDTNYDQFCETGNIIDKKIHSLGGRRIQDAACADEGTGLEQVVDPWVATILNVVTEGCKGTGSGANASPISKKIEEEEKVNDDLPTQAKREVKVDVTMEKEEKPDEKEMTIQCLMTVPGLSIVRELLSEKTIPVVDPSMLPSLGTSFSSCQLFNEDEAIERKASRGLSLSELEKMTMSSGSSGIHFTINDPFESKILGARYLTKTDTQGAKKACDAMNCTKINEDKQTQDEKLIAAMKHLTEAFPLTGDRDINGKQLEQNGKRVIELQLSLPDDFTLEYEPGDAIGLVVSNTISATQFVLNMLKEKHDILPTRKVSLDEKYPITVEKAIRENIDLCSPIKNKRLLMSLSQFATDKDEANALKLLASKEQKGQDLFKRYVDEQRLNVVDILTQFPSCQSISLEGLLSILPGIPPRYYSISSSPLNQKGELHLTVAFSVVDYVTPCLSLNDKTSLQRRVGGVVTSYLEAICSPFLSGADGIGERFALDCMRIFPKPTADFRLPTSLTTPMVLIGPGTGVAPFIGFLKHRQAQLASIDSTKVAQEVSEGTWRGGFDFEEEDLPVSKQDAKGLVVGTDFRNKQVAGDIAMYFGCRYSDHDFLYKEEMENLEQIGVISNLNVAFSRDSKKTKCYVQNKLKSNGKALVELINDKAAAIYICGDGNAMAKDVQLALVDILAEHKFSKDADSQQKAKTYLEEMKNRNKLLIDIWS